MAFINELSFNPNNLDAFGFLPTSQKIVIGNYLQDKDNAPLLIDRVGTGSQVWANGETTMSVTAGQYAIAQTKICHPYVSSHPSLYDITFAGYAIQANVTKRASSVRGSVVAPYPIDEGIYFESDGVGNTFNLVIQKGGVPTTIPRASWDDPLDGTGVSGINYDFDKFTILQYDFLYLGGSGIRFFLNIGGTLVLFHSQPLSGTLSTTFVNSPYFYIRWEIRSTGAGVGSCKQICGSYSMLGGTDTVGKEYACDSGTAFVNANTVGTEYLLLAVRLKAASLNAYVIPTALSALSATNDNYLLKLRINPTIAGAALVWNSNVNTSTEFARGDVAGTNTITATNPQISSFYALANQEQLISKPFLAAIGSTVAGVSDILTLSAIPLTSNLDIYGALNLKEL